MIPKRPRKHEENVDSWLMSYADMITLLLCFFIIFVSVSEPMKDKVSRIAEGMIGKFGAVNYEAPFLDAMRSLKTVVEEQKIYQDVAVQGTSGSVSVELATGRFFANGGSEIEPSALPVLDALIASLKQSDLGTYDIVIESHTSDTPPQSGLYKTNWELSSVRAAKIADYLAAQGFVRDRIKAVGYGDSRPEVPNLDTRGRPIEANRTKNQRVIIRLEE